MTIGEMIGKWLGEKIDGGVGECICGHPLSNHVAFYDPEAELFEDAFFYCDLCEKTHEYIPVYEEIANLFYKLVSAQSEEEDVEECIKTIKDITLTVVKQRYKPQGKLPS